MDDSIATSVSLKIFKNRECASISHNDANSKVIKLPLSLFKNVDNFDPTRLQDSAVKAYPINNRPRSDNDISSVEYHQSRLQQNAAIMPIWMIKTDARYILLDGAHRIVASYIEDNHYINAHIIEISN